MLLSKHGNIREVCKNMDISARTLEQCQTEEEQVNGEGRMPEFMSSTFSFGNIHISCCPQNCTSQILVDDREKTLLALLMAAEGEGFMDPLLQRLLQRDKLLKYTKQ